MAGKILPSLAKSVALAAFLAALALGSGGASEAGQPFTPVFAIPSISTPLPGKPATLTLTTSIPAGQQPLDSLSFFAPGGWSVSGDGKIPDGNVVGSAAMNVDVGCDGVVDRLPEWTLIDTKVTDPANKAEWVTSSSGTYQLVFAVDQGEDGETEISAVLAHGGAPRVICAPQFFSLTINGTSSPGGAAVLVNPSREGVYTWSAIYASLMLDHVVSATASVTIKSVPGDSDADGLSDVLESACGSSPFNSASRPERIDGPYRGVDDDRDTLVDEPLPAGSGGYDCDGDRYSGTVEAFLGTSAQAACANTSTANDEPLPDFWPLDFNDNRSVGLQDVIAFLPVFGSVSPNPPYNPRFDLTLDGRINLLDIIAISSAFSASCSP